MNDLSKVNSLDNDDQGKKIIGEEENYVRLLWTAGWDSTFRLVELSRMDVTVQPTYMYGDGRKTADIERERQKIILDLLRKRPETKADILPIEEVDINTLPKNQEISDAYHNIIKEYKLGSQYEWIGWYAVIHPGCELCSEKPHPTGEGYMSSLIKATGGIVPTNDIHNFRVESRSRDVNLLLGNLFFPIKDKMAIDIARIIKEWGYEDVMSHIWFCHNPIKGEPCGLCRPCAEKMKNGMDFLLPKSAQQRYRVLTKWGPCIPKGERIINKIYRLINK